jgi:ABC-type branched-subunit amino acid transport system substrate-binding protein
MARRPWSRSLALALSLVVATAAVGACSASSDEPTTSAAAKAPAGEPSAVPGFDGVTIRVGELTDITGPNAVVGLPLTSGSKAFFDYVNTELEGIAGKYRIELDLQDAGSAAAKAPAAYAAVQHDTVVLAQVLGQHVVDALLPQLRADHALAAPTLFAGDLHDPNLLPTGVPVGVQAVNALDWYIARHKDKPGKICSLVQDDAYGDAGQAGLAFAAKQLHVELGAEVRVPAPPSGPGNLDGPLGQLRTCDAVFLVTTPAAATSALTQAGAAQLPIQWVGLSASWSGTLATSAVVSYLKDHLVVMTDGPAYGDTAVPGMVELVRIKAAYAPSLPPDPWFTLGYLQAEAITLVLEKAVALGDLSHDGILKASRLLGKTTLYEVGGSFSYGPPASRVPPTVSTISKVDPTNPTGLALRGSGVVAPYVSAYLRQLKP